MGLALPPTSCKVPTPPDLATAMVVALGDKPGARWLEPSHGSGVFVRAISKIGVEKKRIVAVDLDPMPSPADRFAQTFRRVDFLRWAVTTENRFDRIVGNPPFVSIKTLKPSLQRNAASVLDINDKPIGLSANVWYAFVLSSIRLLKDDGCLAFVLPSAAEFADYTSPIRAAISNTFSSLEIYRCRKSLFENVQEGTIVAIARGYKKDRFKYRRREFVDKPSLIKDLSRSGKHNGRSCPSPSPSRAKPTITLNSVANIRLGGVTGHAAFFLMTEERRQELELPKTAMSPVVSRAKHLRFGNIDKNRWRELKESGERIWLFNPSKSSLREPSVRRYLRRKPEDGGCNKDAFKILNREPWYKTPLPLKTDAFVSGMTQNGPVLCINEMEKLSATNTLYVVTFIDRDSQIWYKWALSLLTTQAQQQLRRIGRRYADGLLKFEPGALGQIELPSLKPRPNYKDLYTEAIEAFLKADFSASRNIADSSRV